MAVINIERKATVATWRRDGYLGPELLRSAAEGLASCMWRGPGWYEVRTGEDEPTWAWFDTRRGLADDTFLHIRLGDVGTDTHVWWMGDGDEPEPYDE